MTQRLVLLAGALLLVTWPLDARAQTATVTVQSRATAAILVPTAAIELRAAGVPAPEVRAALIEVRTARIPAPEVQMVLVRSRHVVEVHGPIPDYGAFVSVKVRGGFRGPRLYEVIEVEHRRRGHPGRGWMKGHYRGRRGPPGQARMGGGAGVVIQGPGHPMGMVRVRGPRGRGMGPRIRGMGRVRGPRIRGMGRVRGAGPRPRGMARVRGGGRGGGRMGGMGRMR